MRTTKALSLMLSIAMAVSILPSNIVRASSEQRERTVYLHAQGEDPTETTDLSTVYMGETTDLYFAVDDPNKGLYEDGEHKEPQYDMNGYTVKIYFDSEYFDYASEDLNSPIDYTVPNMNFTSGSEGSEDVGGDIIENLPSDVGYWPFAQGTGTETINGITYKTAYLTVFFNGGYVPQKTDSQLWYNLCKLPLKPIKTGSTDVFIDTSGGDYTLELFAKNQSDDPNDQTFVYNTINGGYHHITIKDKMKPGVPVPNPPAGTYTETQNVEFTAESGCDIFYSVDGGATYEKYIAPVEIAVTTELKCYAQRQSDGRKSDTVTYNYSIVPNAPYLFDTNKQLIPNIYNENSSFDVYVSDKDVFGNIDDSSEVYYTFSDVSVDLIADGSDPETEWVKISKSNPVIHIDKKRVVRLVTSKVGELSDLSWYYLGVKPDMVTSSHASGEYTDKIDVTLSCKTDGAKILYTIDGSDPLSNGLEYTDTLTIAKDTMLRAVSVYDGVYSDVSSFYYIFSYYDDYGVEAFYPSGVYEGSVNVTLLANDPDHTIKYSTDGGKTWEDYTATLIIDKNTDIIAKSVDKDGKEGDEYKFTYKIRPLPPAFAPESTSFTNTDQVTVFTPESTNETTDRYTLYYTTDGTDPITSKTRIKAPDDSDAAILTIAEYTVIKAVVLKDGETYSSVVTNSYDIVSKRPVKPITTLPEGTYTRKIGDTEGFSTQFIPVSEGTEIYYTVSYGGGYMPDPIPNTDGTLLYDGTSEIEIKGKTVIKAVAVNVFGEKSDIAIFEYTVIPQAPEAAPSATISGNRLPVVPVSAVTGSTVKYKINDFENEFVTNDGEFYIDTNTGNAYDDENCTIPLGTQNSGTIASPAVLNIKSELDGVESYENIYSYKLSSDPSVLAPPYADKDTNVYEEIDIDGENNLLYVSLRSLNGGDTIEYRLNNQSDWIVYDGGDIKLKEDTVLQTRSVKDGKYSAIVSYAYYFVPLPPIITLPSGRYSKTPVPTTTLALDDNAPTDKNYSIWYRQNGDTRDYRYNYTNPTEREITHTMSFKAYVLNEDTQKVSKNTIHYYIIEDDSSASGSVYIANPYDVNRLSAHVLGTGEYANGIKLLTQNRDAKINYFYSYKKLDGTEATTNNIEYDSAAPIMVSEAMTSITINAWLVDENGNRIENSDVNFPHTIEILQLGIPVTSLGSDKVEFSKGTKYTIVNDYPDDENMILYYTLDGTDPSLSDSTTRKIYSGEELSLDDAVTVKAVYFSACGKCVECRNDNKAGCWDGVYGEVGTYMYTVPKSTGGGGGGGGFVYVTQEPSQPQEPADDEKYTVDYFGEEKPVHISYLYGYPDGSVQPDGNITREEAVALISRIMPNDYTKPNAEMDVTFPDVDESRWSASDIMKLTEYGIIEGYPDGEFKPGNKITRAEMSTIISRFIDLSEVNGDPSYPDIDNHWAEGYINAIDKEELVQGYEDGTFRPDKEITRAETVTILNKICGRAPDLEYLLTCNFNPYNDLEKDKWYYKEVLEATISHKYTLDDESGLEIKWVVVE